MKIPGIYVEIKGDSTQLKKDLADIKEAVKASATGMSNALNNSISADKISSDINKLVSNFGALNRASSVTVQTFDKIGVDMGKLGKVTGLTEAQLSKLQSQLLKTSTATAQERALKSLANQLGLTEKEIRKMGAQFGLTSSQIDKVMRANSKASSSFLSLGNAAKTAMAYFSAQAVIGGVTSLIAIADKYTLLESKIRLVSKETDSLSATQDALYASANRVRASYESQADMYVRTARSMSDYNISQEQTIAYAEAITRSMVISGATINEASSFAIQFSQAMQKGNLNDDEFKAVMESNGRAIKVLTDYLTKVSGGAKVTAGDLRQMSTDGKITSDVLFNAFANSSAQLEKEFSSMIMTVGQASTHAKNAFENLIDGANDSSGASNGLAKSIDDLARTVEENKPGIISLFTGVVEAAGWAVNGVAEVTGAIKGMMAVAAGELSFSKWAEMTPSETKSWIKAYDTEAGYLGIKLDEATDKLKKLREANIPDDAAMTTTTREVESLSKELDLLKSKKKEVASTALAGGVSSPMGTVGKIQTGGEAKKISEELQKAYKEAYGIIGGSSKEVYAAMKKQYEADRDEFVKRTGDKVTAQKIFDEQIKKLDESATGKDKKSIAAGAKAQRAELTQLNAQIKQYVNLADDAAKSANNWLQATNKITADMETLVEEFATANMSEFEESLYQQGRASKDAQTALEGYGGALDTVDGKLAETTAAYQALVSQLEQVEASLGSNAAGSDVQDDNRLESMRRQAEELAKTLKALHLEKDKLEGLKDGASSLKGNISESFNLDRMKSAYGQVGAYTADIYASMEGQYVKDRDAYIKATGDKIASNKMFERNLRELDLSNPNISWGRAAEIGLQDVADKADDMGRDISRSIEGAFEDAGDALTDFILEGKNGFEELARSIAASFTNIFIQNQIMAPLAGALGGMLFGGAGASASGGSFSVPGVTPGFHSGAVVGTDAPTFSRNVPSSLFDEAPRFHKGLMPDEYPAILQRGEGVFTRGQMAALGAGSSSGGNSTSVNVNIPIEGGGSKKMVSELRREMERTALDVIRRHN